MIKGIPDKFITKYSALAFTVEESPTAIGILTREETPRCVMVYRKDKFVVEFDPIRNDYSVYPKFLLERLTLNGILQASMERLPNFKNAKGEYFHGEGNQEWTLSDWMTALAGEVGEAANIIKKVRRGDFTLDEVRENLGKELADVQCYLVILAHFAGINLADATINKFNEVSERIGSDVRL